MELVKAGETYEQIGGRYGISKSAIYLIMRDNFSKQEIREALKTSRAIRKKPAQYKTIKCLNCGKEKKTKYIYYTKKFCDNKCHRQFIKRSWYEAKAQIQKNN